MMRGSRVISHNAYQFNPDAITDAGTAQLQLWLAQMKRDHGDMSAREMAQAETVAAPLARKSRTLYNPFTGEIRKEYL
jgi:hypothetical protein